MKGKKANQGRISCGLVAAGLSVPEGGGGDAVVRVGNPQPRLLTHCSPSLQRHPSPAARTLRSPLPRAVSATKDTFPIVPGTAERSGSRAAQHPLRGEGAGPSERRPRCLPRKGVRAARPLLLIQDAGGLNTVTFSLGANS